MRAASTPRPDYVDIGPHRIAVVWDAARAMRMMRDASDHRWGEFDTYANEIRIDPGLAPMRQRETLLHELFHPLIKDAGGLRLPEKMPEDDGDREHLFINVIECGLLDILRSNPHVLAWLCAED